MKDQEQHRRNHQENSPRNYPRSNSPRKNSSKLIGQIFGLIYNLALLYLVYDLAQSGSEKLALGIFALNAGLIVFAAISARRSFKHNSNNHYRDGRNNRSRFPRQSQSSAVR